MFANTQMMGMDMGFPDVCLTPVPAPTPIPYPNIAMAPMAVSFVPFVLTMCMPTHNMSTLIPMTNGDNAGVSMGVASGTVMGPARHVTASFTTLVGGMPMTRLTSVSIGNSTNVPGARIVPSQPIVLVLAP
ncbi:DUF4150 domain-containing protein [Aquincola sp. S2]|uniref:DUF4150 domain-containing protein n=1 Tax=Pseudaquabacterium terrae TaxID=2732868 RepID=A0ABX2ECT3_9BURK|nr:DUF4150 domain-containing protein [Aquabacterium terrae]NRF66453.1 DUF4150 domain-containing protein [Aquabacterium terrae]